MAEEDEFGFGFDEPAEEEQPSQPQPAQPTPQPQPQPTPTPQPQPAPPQPQPAQRPSTSRAAKGLTPAEAAAENDTLDGIEDALEGAFAMSAPHAQPAGYSSDGEYAGDPNIAPKFAAALEEVPHERSYDSVMLKWGSLRGQIVHELKLQAMPVSDGGGADGDGFSKGYDKARGGVELKVPQPLDTNVMKVHNLRPETRYVFRAVAKNEAGTTRSPDMAAPIQTLRYAPPRGDRSGWLVVLPDRRKSGGTVKTLGRRFSLRGKRGPDRFFFVLDGTLLSWHKAVDGEEVGYLHLGKLKEITYPRSEHKAVFTLHYGDDERLELDATSESPAYSTVENLEAWVGEITEVRKRLGGGNTQVRRSTSISEDK